MDSLYGRSTKEAAKCGLAFVPASPGSTVKMNYARMHLGLMSLYLRTGLLESSTLNSGVQGESRFHLKG